MKWVLIILGSIVGVIVLIGGLGYYFLSKPIDPNSNIGQEYAKGFKTSFVESCLGRANAAAADQAMQQQMQTACECGAEGTYHELKGCAADGAILAPGGAGHAAEDGRDHASLHAKRRAPVSLGGR